MIHPETAGLEEKDGYEHEYCERDRLLKDFELDQTERPSVLDESHPVCRDLERVFEKRDTPAQNDDRRQAELRKKTDIFYPEMAIPRQCHKNVGNR